MHWTRPSLSCVTYVSKMLDNHLTFDLCMLKGAHDTFVVVVNFVSNNSEPLKHIMMGLFEANVCCHVYKTKTHPWEVHIHIYFWAYVKGEGSNLQTCVQVLKMVVCCHFNTSKPFDGYCLGHVLLKLYQYVTTNEKVACKLHCTSIKSTQTKIHKCIKWPKKSSKGK